MNFHSSKEQSIEIHCSFLFELTLEANGAVPVVLLLAKTPWSIVDDCAVKTSQWRRSCLVGIGSALLRQADENKKQSKQSISAEAVLRDNSIEMQS